MRYEGLYGKTCDGQVGIKCIAEMASMVEIRSGII
jgi:hypothetical protein